MARDEPREREDSLDSVEGVIRERALFTVLYNKVGFRSETDRAGEANQVTGPFGINSNISDGHLNRGMIADRRASETLQPKRSP